MRSTAQLKFEETRLAEMRQLARANAGRVFDVEQRQATVDQLKAQLVGAQWNLDKTVVRAPADGYVTNLALRKGARVAEPAAVAGDGLHRHVRDHPRHRGQPDRRRYIAPGQPVEVTFKFLPGGIHTGKVVAVIQAIATGQVQASGSAATPRQLTAAPFVVRVKLDDDEFAAACRPAPPATPRSSPTTSRPRHVIRKVLLRQTAILNYVIPF